MTQFCLTPIAILTAWPRASHVGCRLNAVVDAQIGEDSRDVVVDGLAAD
jgi:hypothetical protein